MKNRFVTVGIVCTLFACQETKETVENSEEEEIIQEDIPNQDPEDTQEPEDTGEPQEESTTEEENEDLDENDFFLPDLLQCASQNMNGQTIRMSLQNIYGQAYTDLQWGHTHDVEGVNFNEIMAQSIHQSLPLLGEDTIEIDFTVAHQISEEEESFLGGDSRLSLSLHEGLYSGTLVAPNFGELEFHCWEHTWELADDFNTENDFRLYSKDFVYNYETGRCENQQGEVGYNHSHVVKVRETGDGECVDMTGWVLEESNYSYPNLNWNVQGSLMSGAQIHFANMIGADFRGSNMLNFDYGYTSLQGSVDAFTQTPEGCEPVEQWIDCVR